MESRAREQIPLVFAGPFVGSHQHVSLGYWIVAEMGGGPIKGLSRFCDNGTSLRNSISWQPESLNNRRHRNAVATVDNIDVRFTPNSGHVQCTRLMSALCQ